MSDETAPPVKRAPALRGAQTATGHTACTPEVIKAISDAVGNGVPLKFAAQAAGIGHTTLYGWLDRGKSGEQPFANFAEQIACARARAVVDMVGEWRNGVTVSGKPDWHAVKDLLAAVYPDEFAPTSTVRMKLEGEVARDLLTFIRGSVSESAYAELEAAVARFGSGGDPAVGTDDTRH